MPQRLQVVLEPRKLPVQARSAASVDAIMQATIQVLREVGKERLTTTRVAHRAGVSVGTLYQYFPNKSALLQGALRCHLGGVSEMVERVCREQQGHALRTMVTALVNAFLDAKLRDGAESVALYSVSSDVDGAKIMQESGARSQLAIARMLASAPQPPASDPALTASLIVGTLGGVSRRMLEAGSPRKLFEAMRQELITCLCAYVEAGSASGAAADSAAALRA